MINLEEVQTYLKNLLNENDIIVVGVSGGPDSMCLLYLLLSLKKLYNLKIIVAHLNHNQRKESNEEKTFVENITKQNNCIFEYLSLNFTNTKNFENNARNKRYDFFKSLVNKYHANYLMTAHHGDDLIETILMRLTRGSNLKGYSGFSKITEYKNFKLVRPLINVTKEDILKFNKLNNIEYRSDITNYQNIHTRNRFRNNIIPLLKQENPKILNKFLKFNQEITEINEYLEIKTKSLLTTVYYFDKVNLHEFKKLNIVLQKRVIEYILKEEYQDNINKINDVHLSLILKLCNSSKASSKINLPLKKVLIKNYDTVFFAREKVPNQPQILKDKIIWHDFIIESIPKTDILKSNYILRLNSKELNLPLKVRTRKPHDVMAIKNLNGKQKIQDIFVNAKIPQELRDTYPIVVDNMDNIIWIPGIKKSNFDKNINEFYDIIYKCVTKKENENEKK